MSHNQSFLSWNCPSFWTLNTFSFSLLIPLLNLSLNISCALWTKFKLDLLELITSSYILDWWRLHKNIALSYFYFLYTSCCFQSALALIVLSKNVLLSSWCYCRCVILAPNAVKWDKSVTCQDQLVSSSLHLTQWAEIHWSIYFVKAKLVSFRRPAGTSVLYPKCQIELHGSTTSLTSTGSRTWKSLLM